MRTKAEQVKWGRPRIFQLWAPFECRTKDWVPPRSLLENANFRKCLRHRDSTFLSPGNHFSVWSRDRMVRKGMFRGLFSLSTTRWPDCWCLGTFGGVTLSRSALHQIWASCLCFPCNGYSFVALGLDYYLLKFFQTRGLWLEGTCCCYFCWLIVLFCFCCPGVTSDSSLCAHEEMHLPFQMCKMGREHGPSQLLDGREVKYKRTHEVIKSQVTKQTESPQKWCFLKKVITQLGKQRR